MDARQTIISQALHSEPVRDELRNIRLGTAQLYEALRTVPGER